MRQDLMQRARRVRQEQGQVNRHGDAEQRQEQGHDHALPGERAVHEVIAVQLAHQAPKALRGKEVHSCADRDKHGSNPE